MQDFEKELLNSLTLMDSGADLELVRGDDGAVTMQVVKSYLEMGAELEEGPRIGTAGALAGEEIQRTMGLSKEQQLEEAKAQAPGLAGAGVAGPIVGSLGVPGDLAGLVMGAVDAIFPEGDQSRIEAFANTVTEISDKFGSGAVKGYIMDQAKEAGLSGDALEALDAGISIGEFGGIGGVAKGIAGKAPAIISKAGDVIEGAGDAAKARMAEGGTTLTSGVDPDPLIAAAGDAVAKFRAPTEKQPGIIAFHGSGADFDEFKLKYIGTGEGAQAYGYGLYFTDSEDIARYYRNAVTGMDRFNEPDLDTQAGGFTQELGFDTVGGTHSLSSADPEYDYYIGELDKFAVNKSENLSQNSKTWEFADGSELTLQTEGVMTFDGKPLDSVYTRDVEDRFGVDIKRIAEEARKMGIRDDVGTLEDDIGMIFSNLGQGIFNKKDAKTAVESLAGPSGPGAPSRYETIYRHFIEPKIDMTRVDYLMNAGQKKGKMYKVGLEPKPEDMLDYDKPLTEQSKEVKAKFVKALEEINDPELNAKITLEARAAKDKQEAVMSLNKELDDFSDNLPNQEAKEIFAKIRELLIDKKHGWFAAVNKTDMEKERNLFEEFTKAVPPSEYPDIDPNIIYDVQREIKIADQKPIGSFLATDKKTADALANAGIPGIKYRAAGSRGAGVDDVAAERNYVIFDDKMIKILEKYGIVGPVAVTGIAASQQEGEGNDAGA